MMRELKYFVFPALIFFSFALQIHSNFVCEYIPVLLLLFSSDLFKPFRSRFIRGIPVSQTSWSERMECSWNRLLDRLFFLYIRCNASLSWYLPSFCFFTFLSKSVASLIEEGTMWLPCSQLLCRRKGFSFNLWRFFCDIIEVSSSSKMTLLWYYTRFFAVSTGRRYHRRLSSAKA